MHSKPVETGLEFVGQDRDNCLALGRLPNISTYKGLPKNNPFESDRIENPGWPATTPPALPNLSF